MGRGGANIEDQIRTANALVQGLKIQGDDRHTEVTKALDKLLTKFLSKISKTERNLNSAFKNFTESKPMDANPAQGSLS